jgi:hypothetical protein
MDVRRCRLRALATGAAFVLLAGAPARAEDAVAMVHAMSDYIAHQPNISANFESAVEVITTDLQKIQFDSSGMFQLTRPDKLHVTRTGGYADLELAYDGHEVTLSDHLRKVAAHVPMQGSIDALVDDLRDKLGVGAPGADLLISDPASALLQDVREASYIGHGVIDGVECDHLAFRTPEVDWQLWLEPGPKPIPHQLIITSKTLTGAPSYTLRIRNWSDAAIAPTAFQPKLDGIATVELSALEGLDEVPPGVATPGAKP